MPRPARSAEGRKAEAAGRLERFARIAPCLVRVEDDPRMEGLGLRAAGGMGKAGRVAIVELDPLEEGLPGRRRDRRTACERHDQPLVPIARVKVYT